jgi:hypothetical protein
MIIERGTTLMPAYLLLSSPDGSRPIVECPPGENPDEVAKNHGATIYEYCQSREEAEQRRAKDPNGKAFWL